MSILLHDLEGLKVHIKSAEIIHCAPEWKLDPRWATGLHDYDLWHVCSGRGHMMTSRGPIDLYAGRGLWMRPGRRYEATHDPRHRLWVVAVHFDLRQGGRVLRPAEHHPPLEIFDAPQPRYIESALQHVVELFRRRHSAATPLFRSLLLELGWSSAKPGEESAIMRHHRDRLVPVLREINAHPEQPLAVAAMAARTGYGPDHFARVFREVTGWAPKDYILHARIQRAAALLRESSHTVSQIATLLGYQDISFFSRQFRDRMGVSPGRFRLRRAKE